MGSCEDGMAADIDNPACGDQIHISLKMDSDESLPVSACFEGAGCAASQAGASLMLSHISTLNRAEAGARLERFCQIMERGGVDPSEYFEEYGVAAALFVFANNPARVKCATLGARLLIRMLKNRGMPGVNDMQTMVAPPSKRI